MSEDAEEFERDNTPIARMQDALAELDPDAMLAGFVAVAEWVEPDGSSSYSIVGTAMAPWHAYGLLSVARDQARIGPEVVFVDAEGDEDEDW